MLLIMQIINNIISLTRRNKIEVKIKQILASLLIFPIIGVLTVYILPDYKKGHRLYLINKKIGLIISIINLIISFIIYIIYNYSSNQFQFVQESYKINYFDLYLGVDGLSIYFVLLTTIIMPIAILSNWKSIKVNNKAYLISLLLLEFLLITVFIVLDILSFYIFFESILPPLFILIGLFGSKIK